MTKNDFLNDLRIASPCSVGWESMTGSDRMRLCSQCDLHVYDLSSLTRDEAVALIANSQGRICARLHRRADGTVITRDCPVGLRALRKRVARRAGAALTALLSLSASVFAQTRTLEKDSGSTVNVKVETQQSLDQKPLLSGVVKDPNGAVVVGAEVTLIDKTTNDKLSTSTTDKGEFRFAGLPSGEYVLEIVKPGFKRLTLTQLALKAGETVRLESTLESTTASQPSLTNPPAVTISVPAIEDQIKIEFVTMGIMEMPISLPQEKPVYSNGTMTLSGDLIRRLPH